MSDKVFSHKGYLGTVECSLEDNCLFGQVLFVNDLITYEGQSPEGLKQAFQEAVDHYLERCAEEGLVPDKPFSGTFNVRLSPEKHRAAAKQAAKYGKSLNEFINEAVELALAEEKTIVKNETHHHHTHIQTVQVATEHGLYEEPANLWQPHAEHRHQKSH